MYIGYWYDISVIAKMMLLFIWFGLSGYYLLSSIIIL